MGVQVRVDKIADLDVTVFMAELMRYANPQRFIVAHEGGEVNPHIHVYLDTCKSDTDIRNWISRHFKVLKGDAKCVKKWGDADSDMRYFCKGDKTGLMKGVDITASFSYEKIVQWNREYYENAPKKKEGTLTEWLVQACKTRGVKDALEIIELFIELRKGKDGICPFKHGPMLRSVYLALNDDSKVFEVALEMRQKIFGY